jgi:hypothetical protein
MNTQFGYPQILMSAFEGIVLQKSQKAQRLISRQRTKRATIADHQSLKPTTKIACEFDA